MLITNAKLITFDHQATILENYTLYIKDGVILDLGPCHIMSELYPSEDIFNAGGQYVMPGNICAHTHFYGAFVRGMAIPGPAPKDFPEILQKLWWPLDMALDEEAIRYSTLVCLIDAIRHGTTTLIDHHASPNAIDGSLDAIGEAVELSGLRAVLCYEVSDRNGSEGAKAGIAENVRFIKRCNSQGGSLSRLTATFGLHASLTLSDATLQACREAVPDQVGFHIHVAEHTVDENDSLARYGIRVVNRLDRHGLLGNNSIIVHAVHIDEHEIALLADTGTWVTHQPRSNMNNGVGLPPVESMLKRGVKVCLGNDGFSNTMWEEWKTTYLVHKLWQGDPRRMDAAKIIEMGVTNNASLAHTFFSEINLGKIVIGSAADLIMVDYHPYTPLTSENLAWHILFGFHESMVTTTIVAGKILMKDRQLLTLDEDAIMAHAQDLAPKVWARYSDVISQNRYHLR